MKIEEHIRTSLHRYAGTIEAPEELDAAVAAGLKRRAQAGQRHRKTIPRISAAVLVGLIAIMTVAFSSPYLADRIYGSFEELKKKVITVTLQEYQRVGMKFAGASRELGDDYPAFEQLARQMVAAKIEYGNDHQQIDFSSLTPETRTQLKHLIADIQPYFDQLNHAPIARDLLTSEEYDAYIEAQLQRESIIAKAGANPSAGPVQVKDLPTELQTDYEMAVQTIQEFEQKIRQSIKPQTQVPN